MGMVGCEDVCEISGECDLLLGLDCGVGHGGEGVGLWWSGEGWWRGVLIINNNNKINENILVNHMENINQTNFLFSKNY